MPTYNTTAANDGTQSGTTWTGSGAGLTLFDQDNTSNSWGGLYLDLPQVSSTSGLLGDSTAIVSATTILTSASLTVRPILFSTTPYIGTLRVYAVNDANPQPFSSTNLPSSKGLLTEVGSTSILDAFLNVDLTISLDIAAVQASNRGRINFMLELEAGSVLLTTAFVTFSSAEVSSTAITLTTTEVPEFTGLSGLHAPGPDRAARCPRCGKPTGKEKFITDGVTRGDVCPDCYDPPPPAGMRKVPRFPG